ncbi:hypothetical protein ABWW58_07945 [Sporolactobacillus sp. STCC-11]|uniref:hypothetical protein n=1 Tax=Sporolactobacillus caesalpiniae TaxID=3230362 RepID=UPI00339413A9
MKCMKLDLKLLEPDMKWLVLLCILLPIINGVLIIGGLADSRSSLQETLLKVLGSVSEKNWMVWLFFSFGYLVLLQIIWKPFVRMFELNVLLRHQNIAFFWFNKCMIGLLFTFLYVLGTWLTLIAMLSIFGFSLKIGWSTLAILLSLTINFYFHGMIWLFLKEILSIKIANASLLVLMYAGVRVTKLWLPLFYSMYSFISPILLFAWGSEIVLILLLFILIVSLEKRADYF